MTTFDVIDVEQRSPAWFSARAGILTASRASDMLARVKTGEAAARRDLRTKLVVERMVGTSEEDNGFVSADMKRGTDLEPEALAAFESATGCLVQSVGFLRHRELPIGCSPDGILGDWEGGLELKVPRSATHLRYLRTGTLPSEYLAQITHSLYVTGLPFWWFASYDPRFPEPLQLFRVKLEPKAFDLAGYGATLRAFLSEVDAEHAEVIAMLERAK